LNQPPACFAQASELVAQEYFALWDLRRWLYWVGAALFFTLAMVGVVLPGLPTTPFLLLMGYCLVRVSPELHAKAMEWPVIGEPLRDWHDQRGVRKKIKARAIVTLTLLVGATLLFSSLNWTIKLIIFLAALYGAFFVLRLPTAKEDRRSGRDTQ